MQEPSCQRHFGSPTPEVPGGIWGPRGCCGGLGARPDISGRHRASPCVPGHRGQPQTPSAASLLPRAVRRPLQPPGLRRRGSPGSPRPTPGLPALRPPLTPETWRPGPGRRRSGARGSQLWARGSGDGGRGLGRRGRGRRASRTPAGTFLLPAAGGGAGRGGGVPGALTPSAPPALQAAAPRESPPSQRRSPRLRSARSQPGSPGPSAGGRVATSPAGTRFRPRSFSESPAHLDAWEPGRHPPPTFPECGARFPPAPFGLRGGGDRGAQALKTLLCASGPSSSGAPQSPPSPTPPPREGLSASPTPFLFVH